jgi:hypothetical protein
MKGQAIRLPLEFTLQLKTGKNKPGLINNASLD